MLIISYLCGSIPTGYLLARYLKGIDLREVGSGNIGATNVTRVLGKKLGGVTLLGDALKGFAPVLVARTMGLEETVLMGCALMAFVGHCWSVFLGFEGGKGVATGLGVSLALFPLAAVAALGVWLAVFAIGRISSLSALIAAVLLPGMVFYLYHSPVFLVGTLIMVAILFVRHRENISRLLRGEEKGFKPAQGATDEESRGDN